MTAWRFDVVIVGAGAAGLWTALHLTQAGARVLVLQAPHRDGYSSTRNQGWLHSGALYAVFRAPGVTRECIAGSRAVLGFAERHDSSLIADAEFCYVLGSAEPAVVCIGGGPHLIPHRTAEACGATLCVPFDNQPARPEAVHCLPDAAARVRVLGCVREHAPGLAAMIEGRRTFWYSCQKLIPAGAASRPDWRHSVLTEIAPGLWAAYAGKFTTAPVLADRATELLGGVLSGAPGAPGHGTVEVADQPFRADRAALVS